MIVTINANGLSKESYATRMADIQALMTAGTRRSAQVGLDQPVNLSNSLDKKTSKGLEGRVWLNVIPSSGVIRKAAAPYSRDGESVSPEELMQLRANAVCVGAIASYPEGVLMPAGILPGMSFPCQQLFKVDEDAFEFIEGTPSLGDRTQVWLCLAVPLM